MSDLPETVTLPPGLREQLEQVFLAGEMDRLEYVWEQFRQWEATDD